MLNNSSLKEFRKTLRGNLLEPNDIGYDDARKVYNGMIDKHPGMIVVCADVADVIRSVNFARDNNLLLSVRGGGHSVSGLGICEGGLVIDLSKINFTRVDPNLEYIVAGGGCTLGDIDHASHVFGMATPTGVMSTTGIGGLTTGGGLGHFTRKYGLSIDNLISVDMVLADGSFVTADEGQNQDLFWAVRGGGGNFGIITAFTFKLYDLNMVYGGPILYDLNDSEEVMKWYRDFIKNMTEDLSGFFAFLTIPPASPFPQYLHLKKMCGIIWAYAGSGKKAEEIFKPIRNFKTPALDFAGPMPYPALQSMFDAANPPGMQHYWRTDIVKELSDEAINIHIKFANELPTTLSTMHMYPINGAASRVGKSETPWIYREATWVMVIIGVDPDPAKKEIITSWTKRYWEALHPFSVGGAYVNFMVDEGDDSMEGTYSDNYNRLVTIKNKYDPNNLFRVNHNIKPALK